MSDADAKGDASVGAIIASGPYLSATAAATGIADNAELISGGSTYTITGLT